MCHSQTLIEIPPLLKGLVNDSAAEHGLMAVDTCLLTALYELWGNGVQTTFCCCGHGKHPPFIALLKDGELGMQMKAANWGIFSRSPN